MYSKVHLLLFSISFGNFVIKSQHRQQCWILQKMKWCVFNVLKRKEHKKILKSQTAVLNMIKACLKLLERHHVKETSCSKQDWKRSCIHQDSSLNSVKKNFHEEKLTCENQTWCKLKTQIWVFYSILSFLLASSECENSMSLKIIEFSQRWFWWVFFIIEFWVEFLTLIKTDNRIHISNWFIFNSKQIWNMMTKVIEQ